MYSANLSLAFSMALNLKFFEFYLEYYIVWLLGHLFPWEYLVAFY